ncbi:MAG: bifunctional diaminohydroxyphosphoribosylaminopyrimidine deaminase/5-amino-6-(5-phosphoribosylamino)uracil reductase RibD [Spirochaetes bacterium]|nr:bifunctional diaminohydroxyphosphoribosylaminopyrimidine deaminase/5-amino-6-(5-phosphoribosylamino)uracil reductase RibD [Spirochaetota bacterium]
MRDKHVKYMNLALEIAFSRLGKTSPNPSVGAVIVKDGRIISTGGTLCCGSDHAEIVAIKSAGESIEGADIYVTLEPCCHQDKKTPPCTGALIRAGLKRVFIPITDPNPAVSCSGMQELRDAGIEVIVLDELREQAFDIIRQFDKYIRKKKPYMIQKTAMTLDGRTSNPGGDSKWISNEYSRYLVHKLRAVVDAIIIGKNTLVRDNPSLNIRLNSFSAGIKNYFSGNEIRMSGRDNFFLRMLLKSEEPVIECSPLRVVAGLPEDINESMNIFHDDNYLIYTQKKGMDLMSNKFAAGLIDSGKIIILNGRSQEERAGEISDDLYRRGRMFVMLEGGGTLAGSFLNIGAIDQFLFFVAPKILGSGPGPVSIAGSGSIADALKLRDVSSVMIKDDLLINAYS